MKKKSIILFGIIIIILLIIAFVCIFQKEKVDRTAAVYKKVMENKNFTFTEEMQNEEVNLKITMARRGNDVSIETYSDEEHNTTIVVNNETYFVIHDDKTYYNYGDEPIDADIDIYELKNIVNGEYQNGKEEIDGKTYYYEEFDNKEFSFLMYAEDMIDEEASAKIRFYFDGDDIAFIKNVLKNDEEEKEELLKVNLIYEVDDDMFKIPEDYTEGDYSDIDEEEIEME